MVNSRDKGIARGEQPAARYFAQFPEWPKARRSVAAGWSNKNTEHQDEGDLLGVDPLCVQVKNIARPLTGKLLTDTWHETCAQAVAGNRHPIIVEKRKGTTDVGRWWAHLSCRFYVDMLAGRPLFVVAEHLVRVELGDIIEPLRIWTRQRVDTR